MTKGKFVCRLGVSVSRRNEAWRSQENWGPVTVYLGHPCLCFIQKVKQKTEVRSFSGELLSTTVKNGDLEKIPKFKLRSMVSGGCYYCVIVRLKTLRLNHRILREPCWQ